MEQSTYFDVFLTDVVNLPDSKLEILDERVERIFEALKKADLGTRVIGMTKQGSWAQRTIINPKPGEEFDADFMLELREHANWSPADYQAAVFEALRQYCEAQQMSAPPERVTLRRSTSRSCSQIGTFRSVRAPTISTSLQCG